MENKSHVWNHQPGYIHGTPRWFHPIPGSTWDVRAGDFFLLLRVSSIHGVYTGPWDGEHVDEIWWNDGAEKKDLQYLPVIRMESVSDQSYDISLSDLVIFYRKTSGKTMEKTHGISAAWMTSQVFWTNHRLLQFGDISNLLRPAGERPVWGPAIFSNRTGGGSIWDTQFMVKNILW